MPPTRNFIDIYHGSSLLQLALRRALNCLTRHLTSREISAKEFLTSIDSILQERLQNHLLVLENKMHCCFHAKQVITILLAMLPIKHDTKTTP
eukprot:scaffold3776_cov192-Alexandrium_tamarense.AAC.8